MLFVYLITTACYGGCHTVDRGDAQHPFQTMDDCVAEMVQRQQAVPPLGRRNMPVYLYECSSNDGQSVKLPKR